MKKIVIIFLLLFGLAGCCYPRHYLPASSGNPVYDEAYWREKIKIYREVRRQAEAAERERAKNDARQGVYRPW